MILDISSLLYLGLGCLIASVVLWKNWLGTDADIITFIKVAILLIGLWGVVLAWFILLTLFDLIVHGVRWVFLKDD